MNEVMYVLQAFTQALISAILFALMVRAILSWLPIDENRFTVFLDSVTEPILMPMRMLFYRMNWFQDFPIDVSMLFTVIVLELINVLLMIW